MQKFLIVTVKNYLNGEFTEVPLNLKGNFITKFPY